MKKEDTIKEQFKQALISTARVISDDYKLDLKENNNFSSKNFNFFELDNLNSKQDFIRYRAETDSAALKKRFSNEKIYKKNTPSNPKCKVLYDISERVRYELLGSKMLKGISKNFNNNYNYKISVKRKDQLKSKEDVNIAEAFELYMLKNFFNLKLNDLSNQILGFWEKDLNASLKEHFSYLKNNIENQEEYNSKFSEILQKMEIFDTDDYEDKEDQENQNEQNDNSESSEENQESEEKNKDEEDQNGLDAESDINEFRLEEQLFDTKSDEQSSEQVIQKNNIIKGDKDYHIFTDRFDEISKAETLETTQEILKLRKNLDQQLTSFQDLITKLANKLQRQLLAKQNRSWEFDLEEGLLDSSKLTRIVIDPFNSLSFKKEKDFEFKDTIVTLLIDNSGSMRGRPITIAAISTDILAKTLERCGVKVEVLGFTTKTWKGGRARDLWIKNNKPPKPGRLNELLHIIYKHADLPVRRSKQNFGIMLKEGLLKENIDGEALRWAFNKMNKRKEERKILMVISDGAPVDDSTLSTNSSDYLENDLKNTVISIEKLSEIEIVAIGIGHDVTRYYNRAVKITDVQDLGDVMINQLGDLFSEKKTLH